MTGTQLFRLLRISLGFLTVEVAPFLHAPKDKLQEKQKWNNFYRRNASNLFSNVILHKRVPPISGMCIFQNISEI
ncbi:hypothetical protein [Clostridium beijerinckii]|jgi:hypothetical protein|uniref:hypothetical protein n=1 Tax=Clostridium beijerinckii TaxID=1520 RepID=UPI00159212B9|nr:hypothetical protein [Clostridium beijerinckii]